jgi:signal-transduction protein with cAMP-binding, CBS, and nucleotidyltransferase domain
MRIADVLRHKSYKVVSISCESSILEAVNLMKIEQVGTIIVLDERQNLLGIISERDVVIGLADHGNALLQVLVKELMVTNGPVASLEDSVLQTMLTMTRWRARHMPVVSAGVLIGVVSIGDIIKSRLVEMTEKNGVLQDLARVKLAAVRSLKWKSNG